MSISYIVSELPKTNAQYTIHPNFRDMRAFTLGSEFRVNHAESEFSPIRRDFLEEICSRFSDVIMLSTRKYRVNFGEIGVI